MTKPKYQIGDRIPNSPFEVRGVAIKGSGDILYFLQIYNSGNCFVVSQEDLEVTINIVNDRLSKHYSNI